MLEEIEVVQITKKDYDKLVSVANAAGTLQRRFLPLVDYGMSALDAAAITALNEFHYALRKYEDEASFSENRKILCNGSC